MLQGIHLDISGNDYLLITGRSGSGKSTLCRTFNGLIPHFYGGVLTGDVFVDGTPVDQTSVAALFNQVGMVFQNFALWPHLSVHENIAFVLRERRLPRPEIRERVHEADGAGWYIRDGVIVVPRLTTIPAGTVV